LMLLMDYLRIYLIEIFGPTRQSLSSSGRYCALIIMFL
jgi:hypothetical protein